jgi:hypothetical protein
MLELTTIYNAQDSKVIITIIYVVATKALKKKKRLKFIFHLIWW